MITFSKDTKAFILSLTERGETMSVVEIAGQLLPHLCVAVQKELEESTKLQSLAVDGALGRIYDEKK